MAGLLENKRINYMDGHLFLMLGDGKYFNSMKYSSPQKKLVHNIWILNRHRCLCSVNVSDNCFALYI